MQVKDGHGVIDADLTRQDTALAAAGLTAEQAIDILAGPRACGYAMDCGQTCQQPAGHKRMCMCPLGPSCPRYRESQGRCRDCGRRGWPCDCDV